MIEPREQHNDRVTPSHPAGVRTIAGNLGDLLGRKRVFLIGVAVFGLASLATGWSRLSWLAGWLPGLRGRAVAADDLAVGAGDLASAVGVDGEGPAELVQQHVVVPETVILEVGEAGGTAVGPVHHMVRLTT